MKKERINEILDNFSGKKILIIGDVILDHYIEGGVERLSPEAPVPILRVQGERYITGGAGNVAKNVVSLGAQAELISVVGDDMVADKIRESAKREGYTTRVVIDKERPSISKVRYMVGSQQLLRVDNEKNHNVSELVEEKLVKTIEESFKQQIDGIIVSDYAKGVITKNIASAIMELAKKHNVPIAADLKPSRVDFFKGVDLISPNIKEAHEYLGINQYDQGGKEPKELARELKKNMETDVFLTLGADGVYVCADNEEECHIRQNNVCEVFDVSGAGDTSVVALLLSRLAGAKPSEAAHISNAAGAVAVSRVGSIGVPIGELRKMAQNGKL